MPRKSRPLQATLIWFDKDGFTITDSFGVILYTAKLEPTMPLGQELFAVRIPPSNRKIILKRRPLIPGGFDPGKKQIQLRPRKNKNKCLSNTFEAVF